MSVVMMRRVLLTLAVVGVLLLLSSMVAGAATRHRVELPQVTAAVHGRTVAKSLTVIPNLRGDGGPYGDSCPVHVSTCALHPCHEFIATESQPAQLLGAGHQLAHPLHLRQLRPRTVARFEVRPQSTAKSCSAAPKTRTLFVSTSS